MENQVAAKTSFGHLVGGISLVAGTCVGGGMLALPVETGSVGFFPSITIITIAWLFMMMSGLLLIEASLWVERDAHYMTLSSRLLGPIGKYLSVLLYIFMGYGSLVAYCSGGAGLIMNFAETLGFALSKVQAAGFFGVIFGLIIYLGTQFIGRINTLLVVGMIVAYLAIISGATSHINFEYLKRGTWNGAIFSFPLLLATFSYQMMVPSLTSYLDRDPKAMRLSIILGTSIPYIAYVMWQLVVLGTVPYEGTNGLAEAFTQGSTATDCLRHFAHSRWLSLFSEFFAFFALVTSFLGIGLGLFDFISDVTKIRKKGIGKLGLILITMVPTLLFTLTYPDAFIAALDLTGGFGDAILSLIFPVGMVFVGRYFKKYEGPYKVWGGKGYLAIVGLFALFVFLIQIIKL